jgi:hypothetical protein
MSDQVRINGNQLSWSSASLKIDGERYFGVTSISYGDSLEVEKGYGMGRHHAPTTRTAGKYTVEPLALTMRKDSAQELRSQLAARANGRGIGSVEVPIVLQFVEPTSGLQHTVEFERCRYTKAATSAEEGPSGIMEDVEFDVMVIRRDGVVLFDESEG